MEQCILSILRQTYRNIEIILVNNGSTDNSGDICEEYSRKGNRIIVVHQANSEQSVARNKGLDIATGKYITFVDSDDYLSDTNTLQCNISILSRNSNIDFVQYPITNKHNIRTGEHKLSPEGIFYLWLVDIFKNLRFKEKIYYEDRHLMCSILAKSSTIISVLLKFGGSFVTY